MMSKTFPVAMTVASHTSWHRAVRAEKRVYARRSQRRNQAAARYAGYGLVISVLMLLALLEPVSRAV